MKLQFAFLYCLLASGSIFATAFSGSWDNSLFLHEDQIDSSRPLIGYYENLNLSLKKINGSDISLFSNLNYERHFSSPGRIHFELTNAYLDWANASNNLALRFGRQRNFIANTPVYLDGLKLEGTLFNRLVLAGVGGRPVASRYQEKQYVTTIDSTDYDFTLRADYLFRESRTGLIYQHRATADNKTSRDIGLFVSNDFSSRLYACGNGVYDIDKGVLRNVQLIGSYQWTKALALDVSVSKETWKIDSSSIFERKIYPVYEEGAINIDYTLSNGFRGILGTSVRRFNEKEFGQELLGNLFYKRYRFGLRQDFGFGGPVTRADAGACLFHSAFWTIQLDGGATRYSTPVIMDSSAMSYYGSLSIDAGPETGNWGAKLNLETLRNRYYNYENRVYITTFVRLTRFIRK